MTQPALSPRPSRSLRPLLSSCAMGLALAALGHGGTARAQVAAIQGTPVIDAGSGLIDSNGGTAVAPRTNVRVDSPTAVINWTPTDTAAGATPIDFLPANGLAYFYSTSDPNFIVLNRVIPTGAAATRQIGLNGTVQSVLEVSATQAPGGNVWFYSPTGFVAGTGSQFSTNGLILTANDIPYTPLQTSPPDPGRIDFGSNGEIQFTAAAGSQANVTLLPGARVTNTSDDAYTLIVAPSIVQGGTIELDGSVGLIAAESVSVIISNSLFDINVQVGTSVANAIVHTGSTGAGVTGDTLVGPQHTIVMATPQNTAITVLLGGDLGATAVNAVAADRSVILSGGYDYNRITDGGLASLADTTTPVNMQIGTSNFNADLTALTTGSIAGNPSRGTAINFLGNASLTAGTTASLTADLDETISAAGDLLLKAPISAVLKLGTTNVEAGAVDNASQIDVTGNLTLDADSPAFGTGIDGFGGIATISLDAGAVGPQLTVSGSTRVTAVGLGAETSGDGGSGFGGTAEILVNGGTLSLQDTEIRADGFGVSTGNGNGGNGAGGTARFVAGGGVSTLTALSISADAEGGAGSVGNGNVDSSASIARLVSAGAGTEVRLGNATLSTNARGLAGEAASSTVQAGTVDIRADAGGLLDIAGSISGSANADWSQASSLSHTSVGLTRAGVVLVSAGGGTLNAGDGFFGADAIALFTDGAQGDAIGGTVTISASDSPGSEGAMTFTSSGGLFLSASGIGAPGASGGNGRGGAVSLLADGGTIDTGLGPVSIYASGRAGFVPIASTSGTGGTVTVRSGAGGAQAGLTFDMLDIDASGSADYVDFDTGSPIGVGDGAIGQGGTINVTAAGGTMNGSTIFANVSGVGGNADFSASAATLATGGTGQGGTFDLLVSGGAVGLVSLNVDAAGFGGHAVDPGPTSFAGNPGQGLGGTATITATSGSFTSQNLSLNASGIGAAAGDSGGIGTGSPSGGFGRGGSAALNLGGAAFTALTTSLRADGTGGNGSATEGSPGGSGTGGLAAVTATDAGSYTFGDLAIIANGRAGDSSGTISAADGTGTGGTARFVNQGAVAAAANSRTVGSLMLQANGDGGNVGGLLGTKAVAGLVQLSDLASGANSHARFSGVSMRSAGQSAPAGSGALLQSAGGTTTIDTSLSVDSAGTVTIAVSGNAPISAGDSVSIFSQGDVLISHAGQGSPLFPTLVGGDLFIEAAGNVTAGTGTLLSAGSTLTVRALTGNITADSILAADDIGVHALGNVSLANATTTTPPVILSGFLSGGQISITAGVDPVQFVGPYQPADVTISGQVNASGQLDVHAGRDILGSGTTALLAGEAVRLIAERDIAGTDLTIATRSDLDWYIGRNLLAGTVDVAGVVNMIDLSGTIVQAAQINVGSTLAIGDLILRGATPALLRATGDLTLGQVQATGLDVATPGGVLTIGGLAAYPSGVSTSLTANAPTISLAGISVSGNINATATTGAVTASNLTAGGVIDLDAATDIVTTGTLQGSTVTLAAPGAMNLGSVIVTAGDLVLAPSGALSLQNATASGAITLGGSAVTLGNAQAGGLLSVNTPGLFTVNGLATGATVRASSSDVAIGTSGRIGTAGTTSLVELTNNDPTRRSYYGGAGNPAGYSLSTAEIVQLYGGAITLIAPQTAQSSAATPDVTIGAITVTGAQLGTQGTFTVQTAGRVLIGGAVSFTGLTSGNTFAVRAGDLIMLDNQAGSVDLRGAGNALGGRIDFAANSILAVSSATQAALAGLTDPAAIDRLLGTPTGRVNDQGVLRADTLLFSVVDRLYVQNTGASSLFALRRGFSAGAGGIAVRIASAGPAPLIVINGQATDTTGATLAGLDAIPLVSINGQPAPSSSGSAAGSTINGCDFTNVGDCRPPLIPEVTLTRDRVQMPVEEISETPTDVAVERQALITPAIELQEIGRLTYEPLIDEPVTGSGNDDLWLPECPPGQQGCPGAPEPAEKAP